MSEMTRRQAIKLAAGTGLSVAGVAIGAEYEEDPKQAEKSKVDLDATVRFGHGVSEVEAGQKAMKLGDQKFEAEVYTSKKGEKRYRMKEPTSGTVITFPEPDFDYLTVCYAMSGTYLNFFYKTKTANVGTWCCVTCAATGVTACGPSVCLNCNGVNLCCG